MTGIERNHNGKRCGIPERSCRALIAIVGGSGAGKTWLADRLIERFGAFAGRISMDAFYRDRSHLAPARRSRINFDSPDAIEWTLFTRALKDCIAGRPTHIPRYDFATHSRLATREACDPRPIMLVDGLWLLSRPAVSRLFNLKIYIQCPESTRMQRRIIRDAAERGRTPAESREVFQSTVAPMHRRHVVPQMHRANIILPHPCTEGDLRSVQMAIEKFAEDDRALAGADVGGAPRGALFTTH